MDNTILRVNYGDMPGMNKKTQELAMHEKDTGSSEIQIALLMI